MISFYIYAVVTSGYEDLVKAGVRLKCQRYSLLRACGKSGNRKEDSKLQSRGEQFVLECLDRQIMAYEEEKDHYEKESISYLNASSPCVIM